MLFRSSLKRRRGVQNLANANNNDTEEIKKKECITRRREEKKEGNTEYDKEKSESNQRNDNAMCEISFQMMRTTQSEKYRLIGRTRALRLFVIVINYIETLRV